jgi:hypothetical protein
MGFITKTKQGEFSQSISNFGSSGMRKILSIDAGGVRGIIPATILADVEARTEKPVCNLFDFFTGTSALSNMFDPNV